MESSVDLPLPDLLLKHVVREAKDFAFSHGIVLRSKDEPSSSEHAIHAPITLLPSPVPRSCFNRAKAVMTNFNFLMHKVAHDYEFLKDALQHTITVDDFTKHLWNIYETVRKEGIAQPVSLAMNRNDFMLDCGLTANDVLSKGQEVKVNEVQIKQVEFNTMASSFGGLSQQLALYHKFILIELGQQNKVQNVPENRTVDGLAEAVCVAWEKYGNPKAVFLELAYAVERNIYDQRHLEYAIRNCNPEVRVIRRSIGDIAQRGSLTEDKRLIIDGYEVAIVYQRSCYTPNDFPSEKEWSARLMIERSQAIKCPSVHYHLAGTKKVQQVLASPGVLERFLPDPEVAQVIRDTFAGLYSLDMGSDGDAAVEMAVKTPHRFVLKPQREGGGNNTYGDNIPPLLAKIRGSTERVAYILMERIHPTPFMNYAVRSGETTTQTIPMVGELGIFGALVGTSEEVFYNKQVGHLLRSKTLGTDEGGVASGFAVLDSPFLV